MKFTIQEQIACIEEQANIIHESFKDQIEFEKTGRVIYTDEDMVREMECLRAAAETLRGVSGKRE
jgi:hypothetical protein